MLSLYKVVNWIYCTAMAIHSPRLLVRKGHPMPHMTLTTVWHVRVVVFNQRCAVKGRTKKEKAARAQQHTHSPPSFIPLCHWFPLPPWTNSLLSQTSPNPKCNNRASCLHQWQREFVNIFKPLQLLSWKVLFRLRLLYLELGIMGIFSCMGCL